MCPSAVLAPAAVPAPATLADYLRISAHAFTYFLPPLHAFFIGSFCISIIHIVVRIFRRFREHTHTHTPLFLGSQFFMVMSRYKLWCTGSHTADDVGEFKHVLLPNDGKFYERNLHATHSLQSFEFI